MSQRMPPVQYIMTGVSGPRPASAAGIAALLTSVGVSRNASCGRADGSFRRPAYNVLYGQFQLLLGDGCFARQAPKLGVTLPRICSLTDCNSDVHIRHR